MFFPLPVVLFINLDCLSLEISSVCLVSSIMELDGARFTLLECVCKSLCVSLQKSCLLKIIYRPCCEQFHVGTIYYWLAELHRAEGNVHLLIDVRLSN